MTGRHWFRKDVLLPVFFAVAFGIVLYYLHNQFVLLPDVAASIYVIWLFRLFFIGYALLLLLTIRHTISTYDLERFDPGSPASMKRLLRRRRYKLGNREIEPDAILQAFEENLYRRDYHLEYEGSQAGRVYYRRRRIFFIRRKKADRVMIIRQDNLNVIRIDQMLQECIRFIKSLRDLPSSRNFLLVVTNMKDPLNTASAAAGIVNFLGKFKGGTLGPLLLAHDLNRLFYAADRTIIPKTHRIFQDLLRLRLVRIIYGTQRRRKSIVQNDVSSREV